VRVIEIIEVFERIFYDEGEGTASRVSSGNAIHLKSGKPAPLYHFVIHDYLCEASGGVPWPGGDVTDVALAAEDDLGRFNLTPTATRIVKRAFAMVRARSEGARPRPE
jgi:hypothetical protein